MRGFLPSIIFGALWIFSTGSWMLWLSNGPRETRAALAHGTIAADWFSNASWSGVGTRRWSTGFQVTINGVVVNWYVPPPLWSPERFDVQWWPVITPGTVQIPLWIPFALSLSIASVVEWRRRRRKPPWACKACGYDLRGSPTDRCPECGNSATSTSSLPSPG